MRWWLISIRRRGLRRLLRSGWRWGRSWGGWWPGGGWGAWGWGTLILEAVIIGAAIQVTQDTVAQIVLRAEGIEQNWNWTETLEQLGIGTLGAFMGLVLMPIEER